MPQCPLWCVVLCKEYLIMSRQDFAHSQVVAATLLSFRITQTRLALQASSLEDLPEHLIYNVIALSWRARPKGRLAAAEVRHAVQLRGLSRRISRLLRAQPLLLELDFSDTLLDEEHLAWLAHPAWTNRVEALTLFGWRGQLCEGNGQIVSPAYAARSQRNVVSLLLGVLLSNQRGALQRLHGVPLLLFRPLSQGGLRRSTDLSAFTLKELGLTVAEIRGQIDLALLPATLVSLVCCQVWKCAPERRTWRCLVAWADAPCGPPGTKDSADFLPKLASVCDTGHNIALHGAWHRGSILSRRGEHVSITADEYHTRYRTCQSSFFPGAASVRLHAPTISFTDSSKSAEDAALMLCPAYLNKAVIVSAHFTLVPEVRVWNLRDVIRYLISARGSQYAFEVRDDGGLGGLAALAAS